MGRRRGLTYRKKGTHIPHKKRRKSKQVTEQPPNDESTEQPLETRGPYEITPLDLLADVATTEQSQEQQNVKSTQKVTDQEEAYDVSSLDLLANVVTTEQPQEQEDVESTQQLLETQGSVLSPPQTTDFLTQTRQIGAKYGLLEIGDDGGGSYNFGSTPSFALIGGLRMPVFTHIFTLRNDKTWKVTVLGKEISHSQLLSEIPPVLEDVEQLFKIVLFYNKCPGNPDEKYIPICRQRSPSGNAKFENSMGDIIASEEQGFPIVSGNLTFKRTIRHKNCTILVKGTRCISCVNFRNNLKQLLHRSKKVEESDKTSASSHVPLKLLDSEELTVMPTLVGPSSRILLWDQQKKKQAELSNKKSMRWHPMMIRWCLQLKSISRAAYDLINKSGFFSLPTSRTLCDYEHYTSLSPGKVNAHFLKQQVEAIEFSKLPEAKKNVVLLLMK
ncbi:uncharacterized protein LOC106172704 [Lingula anatina]|uniref:Uncharacterized protein LOC106172704 n=1 Tax=Lingula anatina TaxID=7574 RepID=A0A2R2MN47_LINAN|nr:uncharacterized protein LOC106172704 [Lingula anatina]|eukprot:XP_023931482.1 uncharacterized protein LOC106172704 [Lingula anatina]